MKIHSTIFGIIAASTLAIVACNKDNGSAAEAENWKGWEGLKEIMEESGFDTKGVKVTHSTASDWFYIPDILSDAVAWCGTKNGEPWVGLGHTTIYESTPQTYFDNEFVWKGHKVPESRTFDLGYGQSTTGTYNGTYVSFVLIDKNYSYFVVGDSYVSDNNEFVDGSTLLFINKNGQIVAQIDNFNTEGANAVNVGYDHDLLIGGVCYSINGEKLYEIPSNIQRLYGAERSLGWLTTPLNHKDFVLMEYYLHHNYDMETSKTLAIHGIHVGFVNFAGETEASRVSLDFDGEDNDRLDRFELKSQNSNVLTYEIEFTKFSGEKLKKQIKVDTSAKTAELI